MDSKAITYPGTAASGLLDPSKMDSTRTRVLGLFVLFLACFLFYAAPVQAAESKTKEDPYKKMTYENLAKSFWAIGKFDISDRTALGNFLLINECDLYLKYHKNEFEWEELIEVTRKSIMHRLATFPTRFEFIREIHLTNYDTDERLFYLAEDSQANDTTRILFTAQYVHKICERKILPRGYPNRVILLLSRPFTLTSFPLHPRIAELYIDETETKYAHLPEKIKKFRYKRVAYLRLKLKFTQFKEEEYGLHGNKAVIYARVEGYEIYADKAKTKLLYMKNYDYGSRRNVKKREVKTISQEEAQTGKKADVSEAEDKPES